MKKIIKILIAIITAIAIFVAGYYLPLLIQKITYKPTPKIEDLKPLPSGSESYIKDGILYTSVAVVPLDLITKITLYTDPVSFVIIEYSYSKTHWGILAMSYSEYKRLFGEPDVKKN